MKVSKLIEELQKMPQDLNVYICYEDDCARVCFDEAKSVSYDGYDVVIKDEQP